MRSEDSVTVTICYGCWMQILAIRDSQSLDRVCFVFFGPPLKKASVDLSDADKNSCRLDSRLSSGASAVASIDASVVLD